MRRRIPNLVFTVQELQAVREHYELRILDEEVRRVQLETQLKLALARLKDMEDVLKGGTHEDPRRASRRMPFVSPKRARA
jgi:hypothetical protein